jgi:hypothetical protein
MRPHQTSKLHFVIRVEVEVTEKLEKRKISLIKQFIPFKYILVK